VISGAVSWAVAESEIRRNIRKVKRRWAIRVLFKGLRKNIYPDMVNRTKQLVSGFSVALDYCLFFLSKRSQDSDFIHFAKNMI
jgi:hypothetical protein